MEIIQQLGINSTVYSQFALFLFTFIILNQLVFKNYLAAFEAREQRTKGGEELAVELHEETKEIYNKYESKAREINSEVNDIFSQFRAEATKQYEQIVSSARNESNKTIEEARAKILLETKKAESQLQQEVPAIANAITQKLLAKNL